MIETKEQLLRRNLAIETASEITKHPAYPFDTDFPRAMILIIDRALAKWKEDDHVA